jgi:hypothetical protein
MSGFAESTVNYIFHQFTKEFVTHFYDDYIQFPSGDKLASIAQAYAEMGFPGACGSMDVTHVRLGKCPHGLRVLATGKESFPTLAFQCICAPNREILYCSLPYLGTYNDITITANDDLCQQFADGLLDNVRYKLVGRDGIPTWATGGYIIVDGGYQDASWLIPPFGAGCSYDEKRWSEWLESVRKDIECTFGIIKARFRLFLNPIQFHRFTDIDNAWKTACILHNMNITYDGNDLADWERNLNWSYIDPNFDTLDSFHDDNVVPMDDYFETEARRQTYLSQALGNFHLPPTRLVFDTTVQGPTFRASNVYDYYKKRGCLVDNFNYLFKIGLVKWPRRSGVATRLCLRIPRVDMRALDRTRLALYVRNSDFLMRNLGIDVDPRVGEGLFSHLPYHRGDVIVAFVGVVIPRAEYDEDAERNGRGGYCVQLNHDMVLQSYDTRWSGECVASCANSARGCMNVTTGKNAVNNCKLSVSNNNIVKLVCHLNYISPHTELAYNYHDEFVYPNPLPLP